MWDSASKTSVVPVPFVSTPFLFGIGGRVEGDVCVISVFVEEGKGKREREETPSTIPPLPPCQTKVFPQACL